MLDVAEITAVRRVLRGARITGIYYTGGALRIWLRKGSQRLYLDVWADIDCQSWDGDVCTDPEAAPVLEYEVGSPGNGHAPRKEQGVVGGG